MSLWLEAAMEALYDGEYGRFRDKLLPACPIKVPECLTRELDFGERHCLREAEDRLFPIRFIWLMECNEQRRFGLAPLARSSYHPEKLLEVWEQAERDSQYRAMRESEGMRFDLQEKAIELTAGWVYIGDCFVEDFLEIEAVAGVELLFPTSQSGEPLPAFRDRKASAPTSGDAEPSAAPDQAT